MYLQKINLYFFQSSAFTISEYTHSFPQPKLNSKYYILRNNKMYHPKSSIHLLTSN